MIKKLFTYRFELFFFSIMLILFGSLVFANDVFENVISPVLFLINIASGIVIFSGRRHQSWFTIAVFFIALIVLVYRFISRSENATLDYIKLVVYFAFYSLVTFEIIRQVWNAEAVNKNVIFGLMSGYVALGLLGFFAFFCIELSSPNSFNGLLIDAPFTDKVDELLYYSYITLMTIGYGDITPVSNVAQKASMFFAMMGQFYLVIITAVVIAKYMRHNKNS